MTGPRPFELLIVEDDAHVRELLQMAAERTGKFYPVRTAVDGCDALERIYAAAAMNAPLPDFILSDLSMPRLDGIQLLRTLKTDDATKGIPIAVMTSSNRLNDREEATDAGCCAFFAKPFRLEEMSTLIGSLPCICGADARVWSPPDIGAIPKHPEARGKMP